MNNIQLTVKNYRCFDDANPLRIEIDNGFIALVGPNNSGKSSFLKFFYELRGLWESISNNQVFHHNFNNSFGYLLTYLGVTDPEEIFSNANDREITVEIFIKDLEPPKHPLFPRINYIRAACDRSNMTLWKCEFFYGDDQRPVLSRGENLPNVNVKVDGFVEIGNTKFDFKNIKSVMTDFSQMLYIGPFRNAINEGASSSYFDLAIGTQFISTWNQWKTGGIKSQGRAIEFVTADIRQIFEYESLEINASEYLKTLAISVNGKPYRLSELGAGLAQFVIVLGNAAIKKASYILVDEPELHLHPSLQIDFLTSLASYARCGIIYATHSIGLARTTTNNIYSFQKKGGITSVKLFDQTPNYAEFVGELSFSTFKEMGFDSILLVEGVNDVKTIQQFLRVLRKDHRIVILPLGGDQLAKGGVEQEIYEITRISKNIKAIVDSERTAKDGKPIRQRREFESLCLKLKIDILVTERRALENYFSDQAIKSAIGNEYKELGHYEVLKDCGFPWNKNDNWRIARNMKWEEIKNTDVGKFLSRL